MPRCGRILRLAALLAAIPAAAGAQVDPRWPIHATGRPQPPVIEPAPPSAALPPGDAIKLFDGGDLSAWIGDDGGPPRWRVIDGAIEIVPGAGGLRTRRSFGDVQLHLEFATPAPPRGEGQERGNSGVYLMGLYEIQVLDSHQNPVYPDGQAAAVFGQYPPLVNVSRPPGEWQSLDIIFHRPRFAGGRLQRPARVTVLHNGVLVQDNAVLSGPTAFRARPPYRAHADLLPLMLQEHGSPVRFRNIWVRRLEAVPGGS